MPIYEYLCEACGHRSEAIQRLSEEPLSECAECGGPVRRLISAPSFQFKGSGWYVTDYAGRKAAETSTAAPDSKSDSKSDAAAAAGADKSEKKTGEASSGSSRKASE